MNHVMLLGYFFAMMVGVAAGVTSQQFYKNYKYSFLRCLLYYIICLNLALFIYFISGYLVVNFPSHQFEDPDSVFHAIVYILAILVWVGCIQSYIGLIFGLKGKNVSRNVNRLSNAGLIVAGIMCVIGVTTYIHTGSNQWNMGTYIGLIVATILVIFSGAICLLLLKDPELKEGRRKSVKIFGWLNLVAYVFFFSAPFLPRPFKIYILSAAAISVNLIPIIWLRLFFLKFYIQFLPDSSLPSLDLVTRKYQISIREREVMELVLEGKTNQEIEKLLFISYNTVKNHIYNIYQKLGVKSRGQMIHFVHEALKLEREESDPKPDSTT
jgi:DNA-binding CsgD family transcriptional regulator